MTEESFDESLGGKKEEITSILKTKPCQDNMHSVFSWVHFVDQVSLLTTSNFRVVFFGGVP